MVINCQRWRVHASGGFLVPHVSGYNALAVFFAGVLVGWLSVVLFDIAADDYARWKARRK